MLIEKNGCEVFIDQNGYDLEECLDQIKSTDTGIILAINLKRTYRVMYRHIIILPKKKYGDIDSKSLFLLFSKTPNNNKSFLKSLLELFNSGKKIFIGKYTLIELQDFEKKLSKMRKKMMNDLDKLMNNNKEANIS